MKIEMTGDWKRVMRIISNLYRIFVAVRRRQLEEIGREGLNVVLGHFDAQDLNWEPLGDPYKAEKAKKGLSTDTLKATLRYQQSITTGGNDETVWIGVPQGERNDAGEEIAMIAAVHEYGSMGNNIPERPLWQPSFDELMKWWESELGHPAQEVIERLKRL